VSTPATEPPPLSPTQLRTLALLRRDPEPLEFDEEFVDELIERMREATLELSEALGGAKLYVSKGWISKVLGCEAQHLGPDDFAWTPATARGFVAHKAIELGLNWRREPVPSDLVDEALARLAEDASSKGAYVASTTDGEWAQLRSLAIERVTRFLQDFPPLPGSAQPMLEQSMRRTSGTIDLAGKADLVIGKPEGRIAKRVIVDFKTGGRSPNHRQDLRFYALLETLQRSVPPRKLVTYYLDWAEAETEAVTEAILETALDRTLTAIERHVELTVGGRPPVKRPAMHCRWCPLLATCDEGRAHLAQLDDDGSQGFDD
jgi:CRISPR/Cas system-associated exonuclease Cas4 (RecB family)